LGHQVHPFAILVLVTRLTEVCATLPCPQSVYGEENFFPSR